MGWAAAAPIIGSVVGGLMSSGGSSSTSVQKADPWEGVQPALRQLYESALGNFQGPGPQYYPGQTVAPQGPVTQQAQQGVYDVATQPNELLGQAQGQASDTLNGSYFGANPSMEGLYAAGSGQYLNSNPYLDETFNRAAQGVGDQFSKNVMPGIASMFSAGGRYGSNQMAEGMGQAQQQYGNTLNNLATDIYGGNYGRERVLQQQALGEMGTQFGRERAFQSQAMNAAPGLAQGDYFDMGQLMNLGTTQDLFNQQMLGADMDRYNFGQNAPNQELAFLANLLNGGQGMMGSTGSVSQPGSPLAGALGGYQLGTSLLGGMGGGSMYAPGGMASSGFGSGAAFGNQDLGLFL